MSLGTTVNGEFHENKEVTLLTKKQVPYDFIPMNLTIAAVGDSLTKGVGDSTKQGGYIPYLQSKLEVNRGINKVEFSNYGVKGNKTIDLIKRLKSDELQNAIKASDMVILTIGGNDVMKVVRENISHLEKNDFNPAKAQFEKNLYKIIDTIRILHPQIPIVLVSLYNPFYAWFADVKEMDEILVEWNAIGHDVISTYRNAYFVNIDEVFKNTNDNLLHSDYFHPNNQGYNLIANLLYEELIKNAIKNIDRKQYMVRIEEK